MTLDDRGFVVGAWLESYERFAGPLPSDLYASAYREAISRLIAQPAVRVLMAFCADEPRRLFGFLCWEPGPVEFKSGERGGKRVFYEEDVLHYCYIKWPHRRLGIARALFAHSGLAEGCRRRYLYTYRTDDGTSIAQHMGLGLRFKPKLAKRQDRKSTKEPQTCASFR